MTDSHATSAAEGRRDPADAPAYDPLAGPWPSRDTYPGDRRLTSLIYRGVVHWGHCLVRGYHRFEMRGGPFPETAPTLLVQNHINGLCDAHFLMTAGRRPIRILVKYKLMRTPLIGWMLRHMDAVPMYRKKDGVDTRQNQKSFEAVDAALKSGAVIALFPEGESLNAISLRELRSGVGRMAVSAETAEEGGIGLQIVPLGVTYEERDRYRALASAVIGRPVDVGAVIEGIDLDEPRAAVQAVMNATRAALDEVVFSAQSPEHDETVRALERILPTSDAPLGIRLKQAAAHLEGNDSVKRAEVIRKIGSALGVARIRGDDLLGSRPTSSATYGPLVWLSPALVLALLGMGLPVLLARQTAKLRKTPDKLVTLRVIFSYVYSLAFAAIAFVLVSVLVSPLFGLGTALAMLAGAALWKKTVDGMLRARQRYILRTLLRPGTPSEEVQALIGGVRSIREAFPGANQTIPREV